MSATMTSEILDPDAEARRWLVEMLDEAAPPERVAAWDAWRDASPENAAAYDAAEAVWDLAGTAAVELPGFDQLARDDYDGKVAIASWRRRRPALKLVVGGVAVAAFAAAALVIARQNGARQNAARRILAETSAVKPKGRAWPKLSNRKLNRSA